MPGIHQVHTFIELKKVTAVRSNIYIYLVYIQLGCGLRPRHSAAKPRRAYLCTSYICTTTLLLQTRALGPCRAYTRLGEFLIPRAPLPSFVFCSYGQLEHLFLERFVLPGVYAVPERCRSRTVLTKLRGRGGKGV